MDTIINTVFIVITWFKGNIYLQANSPNGQETYNGTTKLGRHQIKLKKSPTARFAVNKLCIVLIFLTRHIVKITKQFPGIPMETTMPDITITTIFTFSWYSSGLSWALVVLLNLLITVPSLLSIKRSNSSV